MTRLCVSIFVQDVERARRDVAAALEGGAEMIELRLDRSVDATTGQAIVNGFDVPFILTCRPTWEGGESELSSEDRIRLLNEVATAARSAYIDVEHRSIQEAGRIEPANPLVVSAHDFQGRPGRLTNLFVELHDGPSSVVKLAWTARTLRDNLEAFELLLRRQKPAIALCMGEAGLMSRVLAKKFGAFLTFTALSDASVTAPGQPTLADLKGLYRWDAIGPKTKVYGVVGSPVAHSMSPAIHNAGFGAIGHDGVYLPLLVNEGYESFKAFMESFLAFEPLDLAGLSVTIPHKENALRYLRERGGAEIDPLAERIGAINTLVIERRGDEIALRGQSTDHAAILDTITAALGVAREALADLRVAVIGAGGTGRTAVAALAECGATVVVYNRTRARADSLAEEFNGRRGKVVAAPMEKLCDSCCHVFINTTSVGMHPNVDDSPLGAKLPAFGAETLVFDTIYNPPETRLLREARAAGARTVGGIEMFVRQAAAQFEAWTGKPPPDGLFRRVVEARLRRQ